MKTIQLTYICLYWLYNIADSTRILESVPSVPAKNPPHDIMQSKSADASILATRAMIYTLIINIALFVVLVMVFEANRRYKQIFLKRYQKRFVEADRVPEEPPSYMFGWLVAIVRVEEVDVLHKVGLDAYMLLRFHVLCLKLCAFLTLCGLLILLPSYGSVESSMGNWDRYTLLNVVLAYDRDERERVWLAAIFGYIFAAYFCHLLYLEYQMFSNHRLNCLLANHDGHVNETTDNLPQKYYTIMLEKIPVELRSAEELTEHFNELFPGDVYRVEVSLDLRKLNSMISQRQTIRNRLEKAIARFVATNQRPSIYIKTKPVHIFASTANANFNASNDSTPSASFEDGNGDRFGKWKSYLKRFVDPDRYGYEALDSIDYYTAKLIEINQYTRNLQEKCFEVSKIVNSKDMQRKLKNKYDTRAAAAVELLGAEGNRMMEKVGHMIFSDSNEDNEEDGEEEEDSDGIYSNSNPNSCDSLPSMEMDIGMDMDCTLDNTLNANPMGEGAEPEELHIKYAREDNLREEKRERVREMEKQRIISAMENNKDKSNKQHITQTHVPLPVLSKPSTSASAITAKVVATTMSTMNSYVFTPKNKKMDINIRSGRSSPINGGKEDNDESQSQSLAADSPEKNDFVTIFNSERELQTRGDAEVFDANNGHESPELVELVDKDRDESASGKQIPPRSSSSSPSSSFKMGNNNKSGILSNYRYFTPARGQRKRNSVVSYDNNNGGGGESDKIYTIGIHNAAAGGGGVGGGGGGKKIRVKGNRAKRRIDVNEYTPRNRRRKNRGGVWLDNKLVRNVGFVGNQGWKQTQIAGEGALRGVIEAERALEMILVGAYYNHSSTAFVTFKSRMAETIAHQMLLSHHDNIEINHAPNPHDIIWENVAIPKSQSTMRTNITDIGLVIGSIFWSSLVTSINGFAKSLRLPEQQQNFLSVIIILGFLLVLPFIFDACARYYEGLKLESEIQNSIMTRYFYYQLINIYVTVGLGDVRFIDQLAATLHDPQTIVNVLGRTIPHLSLYFCNLVIVKTFAAIPLEMLRPWQLSSILLLGTCMDRKKCTRRELRTGAFYSWPMLYGWIYPQLLMVQMIMVSYACFAPLLMPFGALFFIVSYLMYKYQLLYVYVNDNQSLGFMWYAVVNRSLIALLFASLTLLAFFSVHMDEIASKGPFLFTLPLPVGILYFWHFVDERFKKTSMDLSFSSAKKIDNRNDLRKEANKPVPQDSFKKDLYRQPTLTERMQYPEPYRKIGEVESDLLITPTKSVATRMRNYSLSLGNLLPVGVPPTHIASPLPHKDIEANEVDSHNTNGCSNPYRLRSMSINVHAVEDEVEETESMLKSYFSKAVLGGLCNEKNVAKYREFVRKDLYGTGTGTGHPNGITGATNTNSSVEAAALSRGTKGNNRMIGEEIINPLYSSLYSSVSTVDSTSSHVKGRAGGAVPSDVNTGDKVIRRTNQTTEENNIDEEFSDIVF